jgi:hypothetical protein
VWLVEDLRDGRTPMEARKQWFVVDPDADRLPTGKVLADAVPGGACSAVVSRTSRRFHPRGMNPQAKRHKLAHVDSTRESHSSPTLSLRSSAAMVRSRPGESSSSQTRNTFA